MSEWTPEVTVTYVNDEGDDVEITRTLTAAGVSAVLDALDEHTADE
ncbi:hypothetical protein OG709_30165 [Streptomyces sp. NBC_01267]|nr:hypothetical protein [Streptomyces sp. NBC_01267]